MAERKGPKYGDMTNAQAQIPIFLACSWKKNLESGISIEQERATVTEVADGWKFGSIAIGKRVGNGSVGNRRG